ncbi:anhydro-N-acetylmuramic acid kinase [Terrimonas alba]|uniref:anhydro-N-acetylmuramic acid kinase n=1 Tax=Terrimonas alba TaxID=3349636 RepID=UPI0035F42ED9
MIYRAIGLMSGSSLDGLDIVFAEIHENGGKWSYEIKAADCYSYSQEWADKLKNAVTLNALDYQLLHTDYGHYLGQQVNRFVEEHQLQYKVAVIGSHGHTTFHLPAKKMTAQLGDGASIAAATSLPVVSDLRAMDVALGGQGAPIVPIGEKLLLGDYDYFLNIGGIANISFNQDNYLAFDICAANRVLNMLTAKEGKEYDEGGKMAALGNVDNALLEKLNGLDFYKAAYPKSLANDFGTNIVYPLILNAGSSTADALRTYTEHIAMQVTHAIASVNDLKLQTSSLKLLCTGGGAFNSFLVERLQDHLKQLDIEVIIPDEKLVKYKEALIMALIAVLRWREETNVLASVTGAQRDSVGGAMWMGQEE